MTDWLVVLLIAFGSALSLIAAIGTLRMPDLYMRIHAATKCSTLRVASLVLAAAIHLNEIGTAARAILVIAFLFLTAPVAAHISAERPIRWTFRSGRRVSWMNCRA